MKKVFSLILIACMAITMLVPSIYAQDDGNFGISRYNSTWLVIINVEHGTARDEIDLPTILTKGEFQIPVIEWVGEYDGNTAGSYFFTAIFEDGTNPENLTATARVVVLQIPSDLPTNTEPELPIDSIPISTRAELEAINDNLSGNFHLVADIDLYGEDWAPLGEFTGILDGQGHIINNMTMNITDMGGGSIGLFSFISGATIRNIGLENVNINSSTGGTFGTFVGVTYAASGQTRPNNMVSSRITNSYATGKISVESAHGLNVGGLVGINNGAVISQSYSAIDITICSGGNVNAGGINGVIISAHSFIGATSFNSSVGSSHNTGSITVSAEGFSNVGGIVGTYSGSSTRRSSTIGSFNTGNIMVTSGQGANVGGITGYTYNAWNGASSCFNTGDVTAISERGIVRVGGIIGRTTAQSSVTASYNRGNIGAISLSDTSVYAGGIVGYAGAWIENSYNTGIVYADTAGISIIGGIVGFTKDEPYPYYDSFALAQHANRPATESSYSLSLHGSPHGTQLTEVQMRDESSVARLNTAPTGRQGRTWWAIDVNINDGFPYLISNPPPGVNTDEITVTLNGNPLEFDVSPIIENDRTLVPFRAIFEALDAEVDWDGEAQTVTANLGETTIELTIGNATAYVNNEPVELDVSPKIIDSRTLVPLRFVAENFGFIVDWNGITRTITINTN